jgi:predicted  nucleic acid-binding Zn-ribbon protein
MATKKSAAKTSTKYMKRDYVAVLLEDMRDGIRAIGEQHTSLNDKIDNVYNELIDFKSDTKASFKSISEYLSRIEDELVEVKNELKKIKVEKVDKKDFEWLKNKVLDLEKRLDKYKKKQAALA